MLCFAALRVVGTALLAEIVRESISLDKMVGSLSLIILIKMEAENSIVHRITVQVLIVGEDKIPWQGNSRIL